MLGEKGEVINKVIRKGFTGTVTLEQRPKGHEEHMLQLSGGKSCAKTQESKCTDPVRDRREQAWHIHVAPRRRGSQRGVGVRADYVGLERPQEGLWLLLE